ncbi:MAG TPA: tetratricopeptide repeat protein [Bacillota bacterium]|nr:tetratricopeptide repeat protein [Bacillota bacterium]
MYYEDMKGESTFNTSDVNGLLEAEEGNILSYHAWIIGNFFGKVLNVVEFYMKGGSDMAKKSDKVILFPKWKETLERESLVALEQKEYSHALEKLNRLLEYNVWKHEVVMGKIICLMELNRYDEAQDLSEELLKHGSENYYHYLHIYLTILFQTNQYELLMEKVEAVLEDESVPPEMIDMFQQLYEMSKSMQHEMYLEQSHYYSRELTDAIHNADYEKQWHVIQELKHLKITPSKDMYTYLMSDDIHPVIKTAIFQWFQLSGVDELVEIHKEKGHITVKPVAFTALEEHSLTKQMVLLLGEQEQRNPTLYHLMEKMLYRYFYVCYPVLPNESELQKIAEALMILGENYLNEDQKQTDSNIIEFYMKDIQLSEKLYLSIIDDSF